MRTLPFLAASLVLVPLPWHWRSRNVATVSMILVLFLSNLMWGINAVLWSEDAIIRAITWCDITTRFQMYATMALPAASLCLTIRLEGISSLRRARITHDDKRRALIIDLLLCYGVPLLFTGAYIIVQGHRFDIIQTVGCRPTIYVSWPAILISLMPPLLASVISCLFAGLSLRNFIQRRATFSKHLQSGQSGLTTSRYLRLISMALVEMTWGLSVGITNMYATFMDGLRPWTDWNDVHSNFSRIGQFPLVLVPHLNVVLLYVTWWMIPISGFLFFAFFAFGEDAVKEYQSSVAWVRRTILRQLHFRSMLAGRISSRSRAGVSPSKMQGVSRTNSKTHVTLSSPFKSELASVSTGSEDTLSTRNLPPSYELLRANPAIAYPSSYTCSNTGCPPTAGPYTFHDTMTSDHAYTQDIV
ncbi:STE3-domain-containing protein [Punctularia strigosozonata HHB-11173 SS5]|uniref:STE3-domain-containing protein n=1 Tax=Punctularia strigosozonata (strain HHB-11173) TaxID=741275 RepID=UPI0004416D3F|nr:STE3-domain-containing protein [Punctularia strigosozonata HHB-11173 SS5]EIN05682.1 STE3-domain-containing protein [Punctularia strigosozonata HHB-11173 SS5]